MYKLKKNLMIKKAKVFFDKNRYFHFLEFCLYYRNVSKLKKKLEYSTKFIKNLSNYLIDILNLT